MSQLSVPSSPQMQFLLKDPSVTKPIARAYPALTAVVAQIQRDVVTAENAPTVGHNILALKQVCDMLEIFSAAGAVVLKEEEAKDSKK